MQLLDLKELKDHPVRVFLVHAETDFSGFHLDSANEKYLRAAQEKLSSAGAARLVVINQYPEWTVFVFPDTDKKGYQQEESSRLDGVEIQKWANGAKQSDLILEDCTGDDDRLFHTAEGLILSNYQFLPYFSDQEKKRNSLVRLAVTSPNLQRLKELKATTEAVCRSRDLVNEPLSALTAPRFAEEIEKMALELGIAVEIMDKAKIESLKMGGLLAVNKGSIDPPRFCVLDYTPEKAVNTRPLVLVGKGVVYDTGGLSLKPTANSMDYMKSDMAGAAAVVGAIYAISAMNWPVRVVGLIPATDNRPDGNAYVPGDVIQMHNGLSVEVLNTDAEGRMILADALSYARKYDPDLVLDLATLTGAAAVAVGTIGTVVMGNAGEETMANLSLAGKLSYERTVEFPLWDEYDKMLESTIADTKNIGGRDAGAITAGKFLEKFTDYPWIHMDIAGPSYLFAPDGYRTTGGTGTGVRLLLEFVKQQYLKNL